MRYTCPVCGYPNLTDPPWSSESGGSLEICPSCGVQFGYTDAAGGDLQARKNVWEGWRRMWIERGMDWDRGRSSPPPDWDPVKQLRNIAVVIADSDKERE